MHSLVHRQRIQRGEQDQRSKPMEMIHKEPQFKVHRIKCAVEFYEDLRLDVKKFELRRNDRDYRKGNILIIEEFDVAKGQFTGRSCQREVTFILYGPMYGLKEGYCIMSITDV
jgi:ParB family chromosome partitioning protein